MVPIGAGQVKNKSSFPSSEFIFVLSRASDTVFKVRIDISLLVLVETIKLTDMDDHKASMIEVIPSQQILVVCAEKELAADAFSNRIVAYDTKQSKEVARKDIVVRGNKLYN